MNIGGVDLYANRGTVIIGSTAEAPLDLGAGGGAVGIATTHLAVATRAQVGLVRVRVWNEIGPLEGNPVFDGHLVLPDGQLTVRGSGTQDYFRVEFGDGGRHHLLVLVDDPGQASRIGVILNPLDVPTRGGRTSEQLFLSTAPQDLDADGPEALAVVLGGHLLPRARLTAALGILARLADVAGPAVLTDEIGVLGLDEVPRRVAFDHSVNLVGEWARWLHPDLTLALSIDLAAEIRAGIVELLREGEFRDGVDACVARVLERVERDVTARLGVNILAV